VEAPGFKKFEQKGVLVGTQQQVSVDAKMQLGQVSESIEVSGAVEMVETSNASQGQVIDNQKLTELPNLGRNPFMLSKLAQNVVPVGNPAYNRMEDQSGSSQISIAGGPVRGNNYLVDGIPITDSDNRAIIIPSLEAVEEVKIQANTYDAEMARTGGGMFNTLMKSGANQYHGSVYGHLRRTAWDANSFFNNAGGVPITDQPNDTWGASFGGAVKIPHVYDGKNKTFFYLGYEHYDDIQSSSSVFATPTAAEKTGDFSKSLNSAGTQLLIYDPLDVVNGVRQVFPGNIIPWPHESHRPGDGFFLPAGHFQPGILRRQRPQCSRKVALPRRAVYGKDRRGFLPVVARQRELLALLLAGAGQYRISNNISTPDQWRLQRRVDATQLNNLFTLNPTTTIAIRYGFNRFPNYSYDMSQGYDLNQLKFSPALVSQIPKSLSQFPDIGMTDLYSLGVADNNSFFVLASNNFSVEASKYKGRHSLKAGFDYRKIKAAGNDANDAAGNYDFNGIFTKSSPTSAGTGGADLADMLLGYPSSAAIYTSTKLTDIANYYGLYLQDDFRVSSRSR
jgi:trimeric autotransporter adhesin